MLPPRKPKKAKRASRWRSQAHCNWLRGFTCAFNNPLCDGETEVAHVRRNSSAGMGQKPDDWHAVPLCAWHHRRQHEAGEVTFWGWYFDNRQQSVEELIEALCEASPKAYEIQQVRAERKAA